MPTTTPLTDAINALTTYSNTVTGASDTTLSEAVATLASGYGGGGTPQVLPSTYQQVEWIGSPDGTQWIDIGIVPTEDTICQIKVLMLQLSDSVVFGYFSAETTSYRLFVYNNQIYFDQPGSSNYRQTNALAVTANTIYELELGDHYVRNLDTYKIKTAAFTTFNNYPNPQRTLTLNYYNDSRISKNQWYYVKIYDGRTLQRDMVPCYRKLDNEIGMYDFVTETFFTNQGSGTFTKGSDV